MLLSSYNCWYIMKCYKCSSQKVQSASVMLLLAVRGSYLIPPPPLRYLILGWRGGTACPGLMTSAETVSAVPLPTCHLRASLRRTECRTPSTMCTGGYCFKTCLPECIRFPVLFCFFNWKSFSLMKSQHNKCIHESGISILLL